MNLSINRKNNKPKGGPLAKKKKRSWVIVGGTIVSLAIVGSAANSIDQSNLERDNVPIVISEIDDEIVMDYHTDSREIGAKISGVSVIAEVRVADKTVSISNHKDHAGTIKHKVKDIPEGDSSVTISVRDGKRHNEKTITLKRQTKADYDKEEMTKALTKAEEAVQKAESDPSDDNISTAKSGIEKIPEDKRQPLAERIAKLEKAKQEEKERREREERARKDAEEQKRKAEEAAAAVREQQRRQPQRTPRKNTQSSPTPQPQQPAAPPQPAGPYFSSCKQARAAGYSHMRRGEPGYSPRLDGDGDGIACDKHR